MNKTYHRSTRTIVYNITTTQKGQQLVQHIRKKSLGTVHGHSQMLKKTKQNFMFEIKYCT